MTTTRSKTTWPIGSPGPRRSAWLPLSNYADNDMEVQKDFSDLFVLFNAHQVDYLIVGGYALAHHGAPRYTGDIDILVRPDRENARRILDALGSFGFGALGLTVEDFAQPDRVVQLGLPPVRVDLLTSITGMGWEGAVVGCEAGCYGNVPVRYIGKEPFITNKRAIGRKKDLADLEALDRLDARDEV